MPHRFPSSRQGKVTTNSSPSKATATKQSKNAAGAALAKRKPKRRLTEQNEPLFAFDTAREEYNWGRPKRKIKAITRFDPTSKEKQSDCKIGHGFTCPQCSAICTYDSRACHQCHLECCYEAGVGVVVLQDRRISYRTDVPEKKKARVDTKKSSADGERAGGSTKAKSAARVTISDCDSSKSAQLNLDQGEDDSLGINHDIQSSAFKDGRKGGRRKNIFADLKEKLQATPESNSESQPGNNVESHDETVLQEWAATTIAASKEGAYSIASSSNPSTSQEDNEPSKRAAKNPTPSVEDDKTPTPSLEDDINCCQDLKEQLIALQSKYDTIFTEYSYAEEEFRGTVSKIEGAILQRNQDAAAFSKQIISSSAKFADIKKKVASLISDRDDFVKEVESRGLSSVPKTTPNYSTRIDALPIKLSQMGLEYCSAKECVKDLMSGTEVWKQERERSAKELEEMETKHGETFTQCYKEIESLKQQLSEATSKMSTMATEKALLMGKASSTLISVSKVRSKAEAQRSKIVELEATIESLTAQRDAAVREKEEALAMSKSSSLRSPHDGCAF